MRHPPYLEIHFFKHQVLFNSSKEISDWSNAKQHTMRWLSVTLHNILKLLTIFECSFLYKYVFVVRRPALLAPSLVVGTRRSSVCSARPMTTEVNVGSFGCKEIDERWMESGEGLPPPAVSGQRQQSLPSGVSSVSTSDSANCRLVNMLWLLLNTS